MANDQRSGGSEPPGEPEPNGVRRRDFLNLAAVSFAVPGGLAIAYPLINQMNPSADVLALSSIDVDLTPITKGRR
jgi:ubiquinol-cytochrome c reductase iron-sulfur subunit